MQQVEVVVLNSVLRTTATTLVAGCSFSLSTLAAGKLSGATDVYSRLLRNADVGGSARKEDLR